MLLNISGSRSLVMNLFARKMSNHKNLHVPFLCQVAKPRGSKAVGGVGFNDEEHRGRTDDECCIGQKEEDMTQRVLVVYSFSPEYKCEGSRIRYAHRTRTERMSRIRLKREDTG